jgi:hypothetical protein
MPDSLRYSVVYGCAMLIIVVCNLDTYAQPLAPPVPMPYDATGTWLGMTAAHASSANWTTGGQDYVAVNGFIKSIEAIGVGDYKARLHLDLRLGATYLNDTASREPLRVADNSATTNDGSTPEVERYRAQSGIESVTEATIKIDSSATFTGRLGLFGTFQDLGIWSARSDNELKVMFSKSFGIVLNLMIVHDVKQSLRTQYKESLSLGFVGQL